MHHDQDEMRWVEIPDGPNPKGPNLGGSKSKGPIWEGPNEMLQIQGVPGSEL